MQRHVMLSILIVFVAAACRRDEAQDLEKPVIDMSGSSAAPANCATIARGERLLFRAVFTDNRALGNYNIEIHQNFDHHSHSTEATECPVDPVKAPVNPFVYNRSFPIPEGTPRYDASAEIDVPPGIDTGDYHFMVRLTDKAGWQQLKALSVKITN
ncbi:MAG: DUF4625 domain-containing protein [Prevotellaceae bacterium]|jgi:hypothetical protein|nr:DUF4625 domain-containing protein [Prevotellaceae bacterium]